MITLILGKPDSGKSRIAENIALEMAKDRRRFYIATMIPFGEEGQERIKKHRRMREGKGFITLEWPDDIAGKITENGIDFKKSIVLLECVSNLIGNEMHKEVSECLTDEQLVCRVADAIKRLGEEADELIVVTNEFEAEADSYDEETKKYVYLTDMINKKLTDMSENLYIFEDGEWNRYENN